MATIIGKTTGNLIKPGMQALTAACSTRSCIDLPVVDVSSLVDSFRGPKAPGYDEACVEVRLCSTCRGRSMLRYVYAYSHGIV